MLQQWRPLSMQTGANHPNLSVITSPASTQPSFATECMTATIVMMNMDAVRYLMNLINKKCIFQYLGSSKNSFFFFSFRSRLRQSVFIGRYGLSGPKLFPPLELVLWL